MAYPPIFHFPFPPGAAGMIVLTFADHAHNQFLGLAGFGFDTPAEFAAAWASVPEAPGETAFIADRWDDPDSRCADRYVTAEWVERRTGRPIADLISEARQLVARAA